MTDSWTRRGLLAGSIGVAAGLAGCTYTTVENEADGPESEGGTADDASGEVSGGDGSDGESGDAESDVGGTNDDDSGAEETGTGETDANESGTDEAGSDELHLQEANVTAVDLEDAGDGEYEVSVTLYHDDDGEDGYANWWQVETREGEQLGRRDLLHAHSTDPFTRSETIAVPDDVDCVVVRGHDQTHEYGGQAMLVSVPDGATTAVRQGSEPDAFADADCP